MDGKPWSQVEQIFNQAVLISKAERISFIKQKCDDDVELFTEVVSLLEADKKADEIFEKSVFPLVAGLLNDDFSNLLERKTFASYKLQKLLGSGGMGAVFLAEDTRLRRPVALKILPSAVASNQETVLRFQQEALAASAISHPNVTHIYEAGVSNDLYFLALEYVDGQTLRELIKENKTDLKTSVDYAVQIAKALRAAHNAGVTHRDIKPENIVVTDEGLIKVLDFGLAKFGEKRRCEGGTSFETTPGLIIGTTAYMSPEQVRGDRIDYLTDIWSFGVVLYEMLERSRPFDGKTPSDVQAAILRDQPPPLSVKNKIPDLEKIILKCLEKDDSRRYQSAHEIVEDLRLVQRQVFDLINLDKEKHLLKQESENSTDQTSVSKNSGAAFYSKPIILFSGIILLLAVIFAGYRLLSDTSNRLTEKSLVVTQTTRVNNSGKAVRAALSPDGKWLAYALEEAGRQGLFLRRQNSSHNAETKNLIVPSEQSFTGLVFKPDEQQIYFTARQENNDTASLYSISINGGEAEKILDNIHNAPSFSPDGKQITFLRLGANNSSEEIWLADADGGNQRVIYTRRMPEYIPHQTRPAWSPDGKVIIFAAGTYKKNKEEVIPLAFDLNKQQAAPVFTQPWEEIWQLDWVGDGKGFVVTGREDKSYDNKQLWYISYPEGEVTRITNDFYDYFGVSVARRSDSRDLTIASVILNRTAPLWKVNLSNPGENAVQLTESGNDSLGVSWTKSGKLFYGSAAGGSPDIWVMNQNGTNRRQLTEDARLNINPVVTPDERYIIYGSEKTGTKSIWRMNSDGSGQTELVQNSTEESFTVSPDGKTVYYYSYFDGAGALWRIPVSGGQPEKIIAGDFQFPAVSPDNKFIAAAFFDSDSKEKAIAIFEIGKASNTKLVIKPVSGAQLPGVMRWSPNGKSVVYIVNNNGISNLWSQPIDGSPAKQITNFTSSRIFSFDWSPDGREIICSRGEIAGYATLLSAENPIKNTVIVGL